MASVGIEVLKFNRTFQLNCRRTAIVGESGSGKTTIMKLLLKFYEIEKGIVTWGGVSISKYAADSIRKHTGVVMQDNFIFSDTIKQNIILGEDFNESRFRHAIELSCLSEYVDSLPLGVHTRIGTDGVGVSGGEKQRIMLARAIYKRPQYIMLDEATSSLDAETERIITENIAYEFRGKTLLVIAHRLSTVRRADNIIVLQRGRVVEVGTHHALIAQKGYYYKLVKNQLEITNT